jgi:hypothetical protein
MTIDKAHYWIDFIVNKEITGYFSPAQKDAALERASMERFAELLPLYAVNQKAQDDLGPFKKTYAFTNSTSPIGLITLPADYLHHLNTRIQTYNNQQQRVIYEPVDIVNDDELAKRLNSQLIPVTVSKPIGQWAGKGKLQLYPKSGNAGIVDYLKKPDAPVYAYTIVDRAVTYNSAGSTQPEWDDLNMSAIILRAVTYLGVHMDDQKKVEYSNTLKTQMG